MHGQPLCEDDHVCGDVASTLSRGNAHIYRFNMHTRVDLKASEVFHLSQPVQQETKVEPTRQSHTGAQLH